MWHETGFPAIAGPVHPVWRHIAAMVGGVLGRGPPLGVRHPLPGPGGASLGAVPTPQFIVEMREHIGHRELWLSGATATVVRAREGSPAEVLLVKRSDDGRWTPVCGIVEPGELPSQTVVREAAEEACVRIEVVRLVRMSVSGPIEYPNGDRCSYLDHDFLCRWVSGDPRVGDDESTEARFFPVDGLPDLDPRHARRIEVALAGQADVVMEHDPR